LLKIEKMEWPGRKIVDYRLLIIDYFVEIAVRDWFEIGSTLRPCSLRQAQGRQCRHAHYRLGLIGVNGQDG